MQLSGKDVKIHPQPIMRFKGFKVHVAKGRFPEFAGCDVLQKIIIVSPEFLKLNKELQRKCLAHEWEDGAYVIRNLPIRLRQLQQEAHYHASRKTGFPTAEFAMLVTGKKCKRQPLIPW